MSGRLRLKFYNVRRMYLRVGLINKGQVLDELDIDEGIGKKLDLLRLLKDKQNLCSI